MLLKNVSSYKCGKYPTEAIQFSLFSRFFSAFSKSSFEFNEKSITDSLSSTTVEFCDDIKLTDV